MFSTKMFSTNRITKCKNVITSIENNNINIGIGTYHKNMKYT